MKTKQSVVILVMLLIAGILAGCGQKDKLVVVELEDNPTTGFSWSYTADVEGVLVEAGNEYVEPAGDEMGAPGKRVFTFEPEADGAVTLTFTYAQGWEGGMQGDQHIYNYEVKDGVPTLVSEETVAAPEAQEQLIRVDRIYTAGESVLLDVVYLDAQPVEGSESADLTEVDGTVRTLMLSPDAYIDISEDLGPDTEQITVDQFADRFDDPFNKVNEGNGILFNAVIAGDTVTSLAFYYTE